MLRGILRLENPIGGAPLDRAVILKWFYSLSRRKTFVGGTCALPSALNLVIINIVHEVHNKYKQKRQKEKQKKHKVTILHWMNGTKPRTQDNVAYCMSVV